MKETEKRDIELLFELGCLRFMPRSWQRFSNPDVANNTEHIMRVAWLAWLLSAYEQTGNQEKILKLALLHDIPESRTGDVDYLSRQYTERNEDKALSDMVKGTILEEELASLWQEYKERSTIESKLVKDADNLDVELELLEQASRGNEMGSMWTARRRATVYPKLFTDSARKLWDKIHESGVNDWHLNADGNRFNNGDWKK